MSPAALGHPHAVWAFQEQAARHGPCGMRRPLLREAWRTTEPYQGPTRPPHPFHQRSKTPMGVEALTPCPSNTCPLACCRPHCAPKGGDLSSRWLPRELCDQSRMSASVHARPDAPGGPGCSPGCRGRATASSERRAVRTSVGRRRRDWRGYAPERRLVWPVSFSCTARGCLCVSHAFQRSNDGYNASSVHA